MLAHEVAKHSDQTQSILHRQLGAGGEVVAMDFNPQVVVNGYLDRAVAVVMLVGDVSDRAVIGDSHAVVGDGDEGWCLHGMQ